MRRKNNDEWFREPQDPSAELVRCQKCDAAMTKEAVLCMLCGYNRTTGKYVELPPKPSVARKKKKQAARSLVLTASVVLFLLLIIAGYVFYEPLLEENKDRLPDALKEKLPQRRSRPINPEWLRKMTLDALISVYESDVAEELTLTHPPYAAGDTVILLSDTGKTGQGIFQGAEEQDALLRAGGKIVRIPFLSLNLDCRLRADRAGRQVYIYTTATQRAEAFLKQ